MGEQWLNTHTPEHFEKGFINWNQFLDMTTRLRLENIVKQMYSEVSTERVVGNQESNSNKVGMGTGSSSIGGVTGKLVIGIFEELLKSVIEPQLYFKACLTGIDKIFVSKKKQEELNNVINLHLELVIVMMLIML